jgi:hypothetical protein
VKIELNERFSERRWSLTSSGQARSLNEEEQMKLRLLISATHLTVVVR